MRSGAHDDDRCRHVLCEPADLRRHAADAHVHARWRRAAREPTHVVGHDDLALGATRVVERGVDRDQYIRDRRIDRCRLEDGHDLERDIESSRDQTRRDDRGTAAAGSIRREHDRATAQRIRCDTARSIAGDGREADRPF